MNRLNYINYDRGFAIGAVVVGHVFGRNTVITKWPLSFHVSLFFILTRYLLNINGFNTNLKPFVSKKARVLLVPYFIFSFIKLAKELLVTRDVMVLKWEGYKLEAFMERVIL